MVWLCIYLYKSNLSSINQNPRPRRSDISKKEARRDGLGGWPLEIGVVIIRRHAGAGLLEG